MFTIGILQGWILFAAFILLFGYAIFRRVKKQAINIAVEGIKAKDEFSQAIQNAKNESNNKKTKKVPV